MQQTYKFHTSSEIDVFRKPVNLPVYCYIDNFETYYNCENIITSFKCTNIIQIMIMNQKFGRKKNHAPRMLHFPILYAVVYICMS